MFVCSAKPCELKFQVLLLSQGKWVGWENKRLTAGTGAGAGSELRDNSFENTKRVLNNLK